jgi:glycosyltransferase involved in cell wall biosynthesis
MWTSQPEPASWRVKRARAWSEPPRSATGWMQSTLLVALRVALNLEQLLSPSPGGVGRYAARLAANLSALGVEVSSVVARHSEAEVLAAWRDFGLAGVVAPPCRLALPRPLLYDAWHLLAWPGISGGKADLVHAPSIAVPPRDGLPLVVSIHDAAPWVWPEAFGRRGRWFHAAGARAAAKRADLVLTGTHAAAEEISAHLRLPAQRIRVIPYGVDPRGPDDPELLRKYGLEGERYVLWVGSLEPRKGVGTLVAAMTRLKDALLVLVGYSGWGGSPIARDDRAALGQRLRLIGKVPEADLQALYAGAAVFAFPSLHEGFGLPVLEAMAAGTPVVASDIPPLREVAGDAAMLVPPGEVAAWAEALGTVLDVGDTGGAVGRGRGRAAMFTWAAAAEATLEAYRGLL